MSDILITIDTEFSAGGLFSGKGSPVTEQSISCMIGGQSHGLGFMLDTFHETGAKATFFLEAAHTAYLGFDAMRPVVDDIRSAGHDIQLHLHPMWLQASGHVPGQPVCDSAAAMDEGGLRQMFETGCEAFRRWGVPHPVAFRAGNLQMGRLVYDTMAEFGIPVSSSIGRAIHESDDPVLRLDHGCHTIGKAIEVPVLGYADMKLAGRTHWKNLTITGCGTSETKAVIRRAVKAGLKDIVLLTHPFEFIKRHDRSFSDLSVNRVNQKRLRKLCQLIAEDPALSVSTFTDKAPIWAEATTAGPAAQITAPLPSVMARVAENRLNDLFRWY